MQGQLHVLLMVQSDGESIVQVCFAHTQPARGVSLSGCAAASHAPLDCSACPAVAVLLTASVGFVHEPRLCPEQIHEHRTRHRGKVWFFLVLGMRQTVSNPELVGVIISLLCYRKHQEFGLNQGNCPFTFHHLNNSILSSHKTLLKTEVLKVVCSVKTILYLAAGGVLLGVPARHAHPACRGAQSPAPSSSRRCCLVGEAPSLPAASPLGSSTAWAGLGASPIACAPAATGAHQSTNWKLTQKTTYFSSPESRRIVPHQVTATAPAVRQHLNLENCPSGNDTLASARERVLLMCSLTTDPLPLPRGSVTQDRSWPGTDPHVRFLVTAAASVYRNLEV